VLDLARETGVSKSTVSRVLNGSPNVSPEARARVNEGVKRLDYRINLAARSLRTTKTALVGLLVPAINNEVFAEIAEQLDAELRKAGVMLAVTSSGWSPEGELSALDALESRGVDAIVVALADDRERRVAARLRLFDAPVVLLDREVSRLQAEAVLTDNRAGIVLCIEHLARLGHRAIGMSTSTDSTRPGRELVAAYRDSLSRLGLDTSEGLLVRSDTYTREAGWAAAKSLIDAGATAIIGCGPVAFIAGALDHLSDRGLDIPQDVSFVEYTDSELATVNRPRLSVILRPVGEIGRLAARLTLARMANERQPRRVEFVSTSFLDRESTAPPRPQSRKGTSASKDPA
jgi:LacI family transcriptional regulator